MKERILKTLNAYLLTNKEALSEEEIKDIEEQRKIMIRISKNQWDSIDRDYKGIWKDYYGEKPEWIGKRVVMSGCIAENPNELGYLMVEGIHFIIEDGAFYGKCGVPTN